MSRPPQQINSLSGGSQNFICPGGLCCNTCFVIHFYTVLSEGSNTTIVCCPGGGGGGLEVLQRFVTGCSSVGGGGVRGFAKICHWLFICGGGG